jgi:hypothetical protein
MVALIVYGDGDGPHRFHHDWGPGDMPHRFDE